MINVDNSNSDIGNLLPEGDPDSVLTAVGCLLLTVLCRDRIIIQATGEKILCECS